MSLTLLHADCFDVMSSMEKESVDVLLTDPAYDIRSHSRGNITFKDRKDMNNDIGDWDVMLDIPRFIRAVIPLMKPTGNMFIFCNVNTIGMWHAQLDPIFDTCTFFVWHKTNPPPRIRKSSFLHSCELMICAWNKGHTWNFTTQTDMHNFFESGKCAGKERLKYPFHPAQKPLSLLTKLIALASNEGDMIFDPFMGVGSTGVAALQGNRSFVGVEIREDFFCGAEKRLGGVAH